MPCSVVEVNRRFLGTYCLRLQSGRVSRTSKQANNGGLVFDPQDEGSTFLRNGS
jgi:hypothetical protein